MFTILTAIIFVATSIWLVIFVIAAISVIYDTGTKNLTSLLTDLFTMEAFWVLWLWVILWIASSWYLFGIF